MQKEEGRMNREGRRTKARGEREEDGRKMKEERTRKKEEGASRGITCEKITPNYKTLYTNITSEIQNALGGDRQEVVLLPTPLQNSKNAAKLRPRLWHLYFEFIPLILRGWTRNGYPDWDSQ